MAESNTSLTQWIEDYTSELYSWAFYKISERELAKDLVQDTFLAASEKIENFKGDSSPKTWLFSILNHKIIDHYRKKTKQTLSIEDQNQSNFFNGEGDWITEKSPQAWEESESHLLDDDEFQDILQKCLEALPEKWNLIVKLKYLMSKKGEEICQELDIAPTNYWQMIHRAKLQLRECIETSWFQN